MAANTSRSSTKRSGTSARRKPSSAKKTPARKTAATRKNTRSASTGSKRSPSGRRTTASRNSSGVVGTVKQAAGKAAAPAIAVGVAAAGIAGGIALKNRSNGTKLLGVRVPDIDPKSVAQSVGKASKRFARTSKNVSKDLERAGDQAERIGKILD